MVRIIGQQPPSAQPYQLQPTRIRPRHLMPLRICQCTERIYDAHLLGSPCPTCSKQLQTWTAPLAKVPNAGSRITSVPDIPTGAPNAHGIQAFEGLLGIRLQVSLRSLYLSQCQPASTYPSNYLEALQIYPFCISSPRTRKLDHQLDNAMPSPWSSTLPQHSGTLSPTLMPHLISPLPNST